MWNPTPVVYNSKIASNYLSIVNLVDIVGLFGLLFLRPGSLLSRPYCFTAVGAGGT